MHCGRSRYVKVVNEDVPLLPQKSFKEPHSKSKHLLERQERRERLNARVLEADSDADDF
jgi:hypothetical protein